MKVRILALACACSLCGLLALSACASQRPAPVTGTPTGDPPTSGKQAGQPVAGSAVTKEVPHSTESITDIKEREAKEPLPPLGDTAIHSHKIRGLDNAAPKPSQGIAPAGKNKPGNPFPPETGGY